LLYFRSAGMRTALALSSIHLLLMFAVAPILYKLGFGFDAFVHRATETWIHTHGSILPKQPYYIGQYAFVVWLAHLTGTSIGLVDIYLVPLLAALFVPGTIVLSLRAAWDMPNRYALWSVWLVPFVPFLSFHLTTPYNLALFFTILAIFTMLPFLLGSAALVTHPLIGVPVFLFCLGGALLRKLRTGPWRNWALVLSPLFTLLAPPLMFTINGIRAGVSFPNVTNPLTHIPDFLSLFARPYWYAKDAPAVFELLYAWQWLLVPTTIALATFGWYAVKKERWNPLLMLYPLTALSFLASAWLLKSWIIFPDVVAYEQGDYPLRLIKASIIFLLPFAGYGLSVLVRYTKTKRARYSFIATTALLLMLSLYLSYPQRNAKARFPGFNVTASDFRAVEWIHNRHTSYDYIVLSNQLVSAAALTNYSFAKYFDTPNGAIFYYALPTGGLLYQEYGHMLYQGQKREFMEHAMDIAGVDTAYFVVNSYWANATAIIAEAQKNANESHRIDDGKVWIFLYER
jgi:hypothetical protein